jgi:hypothetical protein
MKTGRAALVGKAQKFIYNHKIFLKRESFITAVVVHLLKKYYHQVTKINNL